MPTAQDMRSTPRSRSTESERSSFQRDFQGEMGQSEAAQGDHSEGFIARAIEEQTAKLPSDLFLWAAGASIVGSLLLQCNGREHASLFVGQWAPTFLILGLYNKIVKVAGSDRQHGNFAGAS
jgi:hypothetical protein